MNSDATIHDRATRDALAEQIRIDGFALLPGLCRVELVSSLLETSLHQSRRLRAALGSRPIGIGSAAGYIEIVQRSPGRWDVPISPTQFGIEEAQMPWWPLVTELLGEDAEHAFSGVVSSEPGSPAQHWHIDSPHESAKHLGAHAINVFVALHDIPLPMGPTELARGSHRLTNHLSNPKLRAEELVYQHAGSSPEQLVRGTAAAVPECCVSAMTAGSCLVFDDRLLHRGLGNGSDAMRHLAYFAYHRRGYHSYTHFETQRSVFDPAH